MYLIQTCDFCFTCLIPWMNKCYLLIILKALSGSEIWQHLPDIWLNVFLLWLNWAAGGRSSRVWVPSPSRAATTDRPQKTAPSHLCHHTRQTILVDTVLATTVTLTSETSGSISLGESCSCTSYTTWTCRRRPKSKHALKTNNCALPKNLYLVGFWFVVCLFHCSCYLKQSSSTARLTLN